MMVGVSSNTEAPLRHHGKLPEAFLFNDWNSTSTTGTQPIAQIGRILSEAERFARKIND
jgi:hypothetical protein